MWVCELAEAKARNDFATVWKITRLLAGGIGPKCRKLNSPHYTGDMESWKDLLSKPGCEGGCLASPAPPPPPAASSVRVSTHDIEMAKEDKDSSKKRMWKVKPRKAPPR